MDLLAKNLSITPADFDRFVSEIVQDPKLVAAMGEHWQKIVQESDILYDIAQTTLQQLEDGRPPEAVIILLMAKMLQLGFGVQHSVDEPTDKRKAN